MSAVIQLRLVAVSAIVGLASLAIPRTASAIPSFARKYGTSCITCHTVYPKLNPFGEAFRRNGFRFPGTDSEMVKQAPVALGADAYKKVFPDAVWPGTLPGYVPLSFGFNGSVALHPDTSSSGGRADNGAVVAADNLVEEAHLWAGGSLDDSITYFAELTVASDGVSIERAQLFFNDLAGPDHAFNLWVGKGPGTLTSFGPHASYLADLAMPPLAVTALFGATSSSWNLTDNVNSVEVNGILSGVVNWAVGLTTGANSETRAPQNVYAHIGGKLGGVRLDGEENSSVPNAAQPWAETALTVDAFFYHSSSRFTIADPASTDTTPLPDLVRDDDANVIGASLRAQYLSLEFNAGFSLELHSNPLIDAKATVLSQWDELSYVVYPWLVPAARFEFTQVSPDGGDTASDMRLSVGVAALLRPNIKLVLSGQLETCTGAPPGGWSNANGVAVPVDATSSVPLEIESVTLLFAYAY